MAQPLSTPQLAVSWRSRPWMPALAVGGTAFAATLLVGAGVLWFQYGTAVFFEMITSGIAGCL